MKYRHRFQVRASLERVSDFHSRAASMPAITPPPLRVQLHRAPDIMGEGDEMDFSLGIGPISIRCGGWKAWECGLACPLCSRFEPARQGACCNDS